MPQVKRWRTGGSETVFPQSTLDLIAETGAFQRDVNRSRQRSQKRKVQHLAPKPDEQVPRSQPSRNYQGAEQHGA